MFLLALPVFLLSLGSPVPSPDPLIPALSSLMGPLVSVLQTVGTVGGATAGGVGVGTAGAGGLVTAPAIAGTVATAPAIVPAMTMMSSLLPGIGLGLLKGIFLGSVVPEALCSLNYLIKKIIPAELLKKEAPKKQKGYGHHPVSPYGHHQPQYGYQRYY